MTEKIKSKVRCLYWDSRTNSCTKRYGPYKRSKKRTPSCPFDSFEHCSTYRKHFHTDVIDG